MVDRYQMLHGILDPTQFVRLLSLLEGYISRAHPCDHRGWRVGIVYEKP